MTNYLFDENHCKFETRKLLWSGTLSEGGTINLSDDISKYNIFVLRVPKSNIEVIGIRSEITDEIYGEYAANQYTLNFFGTYGYYPSGAKGIYLFSYTFYGYRNNERSLTFEKPAMFAIEAMTGGQATVVNSYTPSDITAYLYGIC